MLLRALIIHSIFLIKLLFMLILYSVFTHMSYIYHALVIQILVMSMSLKSLLRWRLTNYPCTIWLYLEERVYHYLRGICLWLIHRRLWSHIKMLWRNLVRNIMIWFLYWCVTAMLVLLCIFWAEYWNIIQLCFHIFLITLCSAVEFFRHKKSV